jgi:hypothetical protein
MTTQPAAEQPIEDPSPYLAHAEAFLHAGGLRAVKRWAEREYGVVGWKKTGPDHWEGSFS